jgi:hypothetical protein
MVRQAIGTICLAGFLLTGCATPRSGESIALPGNDDAAAALEIRAALHEAGLPVEAASGPTSLFVYRRGMATLLSPVLQTDGLDRVIGARSYAPSAGVSGEELAGLARTLNERLNVASFKLADDALLMEANFTFVDRLSIPQLLAFLDWLDQIELAIRHVDAETGLLLLTGSGA